MDRVDNVDVEVRLADGSRWSATVVTVAEVERLMRKWATSKEASGRRCFWCPDGLIVRDAGVAGMTQVLAALLDSGEFSRILQRLDDDWTGPRIYADHIAKRAVAPRTKARKWEQHVPVGTFDLRLCTDPGRPSTWTVVNAGLWADPQLFSEERAADLGHSGFTPHHPLLFLPRQPAPVTFTARALSCHLSVEWPSATFRTAGCGPRTPPDQRA